MVGKSKGAQNKLRSRIIAEAMHIIKTGSTIRETAKELNISKSTVYNDVTENLYKIDSKLANQVKKVLDINKAERHIRGGEATWKKFNSIKENRMRE